MMHIYIYMMHITFSLESIISTIALAKKTQKMNID